MGGIFLLGSLVRARPLHLASARPFGRLKAPPGLSLLRSAAQTRTEPWKFHKPAGRDTDFSSTPLHKQGQELRSEQTLIPIHEQNPFTYFFALTIRKSLLSVALIASFTSSAILNGLFAICNSRLLPTNQIVNCDGGVRPGGRTLFLCLFLPSHKFALPLP